MKIEISSNSNSFKIPPNQANEIFSTIENEMKFDPYSDEYTYYFLLNYYVKELLIEKIGFEFVLEICGLEKTSYKYIFDHFLNIFPEILKSLNTHTSFTLDMIEQGWNNYYHFRLIDDYYLIHTTNIYGASIGDKESITIHDANIVFNHIKDTFLNFIKQHFNDEFYLIYQKYLNVT